MKDFNLDLFDPAETVMESSSSSDYSRTASSSDADFGFAFNDSNFSDRILHIEIMADHDEASPNFEGCTTILDWVRHRKRRREDVQKDNGILTIFPISSVPFLYKPIGGKHIIKRYKKKKNCLALIA